MNFKRHLELEGRHAPFSASQSSWLRYNDDKLVDTYLNLRAKEMGTIIHEWAAQTINLGFKQPRSNKTICAYVNDAIGYKMDTEVVLYYSDYFFGTADAISFRNNILRIHDLKTGSTGKIESHIEQLMVYAAIFCLEYKVKPIDIQIELRVYKNDEVLVENPDAEDIQAIMNNIVHKNKILESVDRKGV